MVSRKHSITVMDFYKWNIDVYNNNTTTPPLITGKSTIAHFWIELRLGYTCKPKYHWILTTHFVTYEIKLI